MIAIAKCLIKGPYISDKHVSFPCFSSATRVVIVIQQEGSLQAGCLDQTLRAIVFLFNNARKAAKNGVLKNRNANSIEANAICSIWLGDALGRFLDIVIVFEVLETHLPVLHRARYDAALATDRLVAKVIEPVLLAVNCGRSLFDRRLQLVKHFEVWLLKNITLVIFLWTRSDPESVDPEEWSEFLLEVVLFLVCPATRRHPQLLRVISDLNIHETKETEGQQHQPSEQERQWVASNGTSQSIRYSLKHFRAFFCVFKFICGKAQLSRWVFVL